MFKEERDENLFSWKQLGDLERGRPNLGMTCPVVVYRLLQYTLRDELIKQFDVEKGKQVFINAGKLAGAEFCRNMLNTDLEFNEFVAELQTVLKNLNVGILRIEKADLEAMELVLTVAEDLDCSGLPPSDETVCEYDEGFIAGILNTYTGKEFHVKEIDCWTSGDTVCRFAIRLK